jgi:hypothetical protein
MTIHWESLVAVFAVSLGSTVAVVGLVTLAMLGLSARTAAPGGTGGRPAAGTAVAVTCLGAAALIVLLGLWAIVAR